MDVYTVDKFADDSVDEKRLEKAERMAERKAATQKFSEHRDKPYRKPLVQLDSDCQPDFSSDTDSG